MARPDVDAPGEYVQARQFHTRALRLAAAQGFKPGEMYAETGLALRAPPRRRARPISPRSTCCLCSTGIAETVPSWASTLILAELGFVAELRGDVASAKPLQLERFSLACRGGDPRAIALVLEGLAGAPALGREIRRAARLLGAAAHTRESVGTPLPQAERADIERAAARIVAELGAEASAAEFAAGAGSDPQVLALI